MVTGVIVWEYSQGDAWVNFERHLSDCIEDAFSKDCRSEIAFTTEPATGASVRVNLSDMTLLHSTSNETSPHFIRRNVYSKDSFPGKGIAWQWYSDSDRAWKDYDLAVASFLDDALPRRTTGVIDLETHFPKHTSLINLNNMTEIRKRQGCSVPIRRVDVKPFVSKCLNSPPPQYARMPATNFNAPQSSFVRPYPQRPIDVPAVRATMPPNGLALTYPSQLVNQNFVAAVPSGQRIRFQIPRSDLQMSLNEESLLLPPLAANSRKRTHDAIPQTTSSKFAVGNSNFRGPSLDVDGGGCAGAIGLPACRMPGPYPPQNANLVRQIAPFQHCSRTSGPQTQQDSRRQSVHTSARTSSDRRRCRDSSYSTPATLGREVINLVRPENYTTTFESITEQQFIVQILNYPSEDCAICYCGLSEESAYWQSNSSARPSADSPNVVCFRNCRHHFHLECLKAMYNAGMKNGSIQCPQCKAIYGTKRGNCPPGDMIHDVWPSSLPGHEDCGTILIKYFVPQGIQGPEHPNPGRPYTARGFPRCCYLPDNAEGHKVLKLLIKAWKRRLTFTVGCSITTGESDTVVWNEIHHKTEDQNSTGHGYPDPNYLANVTSELAAHGVNDGDDE